MIGKTSGWWEFDNEKGVFHITTITSRAVEIDFLDLLDARQVHQHPEKGEWVRTFATVMTQTAASHLAELVRVAGDEDDNVDALSTHVRDFFCNETPMPSWRLEHELSATLIAVRKHGTSVITAELKAAVGRRHDETVPAA